ncbi:hypothetical protein JQ628_22245 [Bradyrhizobium lablabi]|uniref:COG3904 family protein n=1 Tax=Bradyrhizobium lablabi TaxID=722472 RepID=UPI001BAC3B69|nr:hypothetical protein [Bradyrhizobium lablabi]MBR1124265.1 hypothetical protein [Bradyrhizobium lablabi]
MHWRVILLAILILSGGSASAAVPKARPAPPKAAAPPMAFYVVKGAPDACGRGCDSWIAVEGQVDSAAALRFKKFLARTGNRSLPLYFNSPGGNLDQALAMGAMLRERRAVARVAHTVVKECGFEAQDSEACIKLKLSGRELHGDLFTRGATCNSACPYLMLGATTREIAADALLAVHSPKVIVYFRGVGVPTAEMRAAAAQRGAERADRMLASYIVKMGADIGLLQLARTIKFESMHVLTRDEIVRFGIDRREFVETGWTFESSGRSMARKAVVERNEADRSWRTSHWRIVCFNADQFELDFQRPAVSGSVFPALAVSNAASAARYFKSPPARLLGFEIWGLRLNKEEILSLMSSGQFSFTEMSQAAGARQLARTATLSNDGLGRALNSLIETCPPPKSAPARQTIGVSEAAPK